MEKTLDYDVVVVGGGPAGSVAAIAAARHGAHVLLVEQYGYLGGMLTAGGVGPQMTYHAGDTQVVRGIAQEIVDRMVEAGMSPGHMTDFVGYASSVTPFDAEGLKVVLEQMALEAGVELLYRLGVLHDDTHDGYPCFHKRRSFPVGQQAQKKPRLGKARHRSLIGTRIPGKRPELFLPRQDPPGRELSVRIIWLFPL